MPLSRYEDIVFQSTGFTKFGKRPAAKHSRSLFKESILNSQSSSDRHRNPSMQVNYQSGYTSTSRDQRVVLSSSMDSTSHKYHTMGRGGGFHQRSVDKDKISRVNRSKRL